MPRMNALADEAAAPTCQICSGPLPCKPCSKAAERPGVTRHDNITEVVLPVGEDRDRIEAMLRSRGLDPDEWALQRVTVNEWEGFHVGPDGHRVMVPLHQTKAYLEYRPPFEETPAGEFLTRLEAMSPASRPPRRRLKPEPGPITWVLFGDDQAPFINHTAHELLCEFLRDTQPGGLVHMGDLADFDSISRHRPKQGTRFESHAVDGIDVSHRIMAERVEAAGDNSTGRRWFLIGNHDHRLNTILTDRLPQLFGLRQAATDDNPDPAPLLTVHHLARLGELGFEVASDPRGDYPYGSVRIADELLATHGWVAQKGAGASARGSIEHLNSGIAVGHTHRLAATHLTRWSPDGEPQVYSAVETGTLADAEGLGYARYPDWQTGWVTVTVRDGAHHVDLAVIRGDTLRWRGQQWRLTARGIRVS